MRALLAGMWCSLAGLVAPAIAAPAPDLLGKSLSVDWTENRQIRVGGELRTGPVTFQLRIYVSSEGHIFNKVTSSSHVVAASAEHVGSSGSSLGGGVRSVRAEGRSIVVQSIFGNYARTIHIDVASGGGSCSVQISTGKEVGSAPKAFQVNGVKMEVISTTVTGSSCAAQQGNVFAH
jgi:hypothetical protein